MMLDPDAWLARPQPSPEMCRLFHGVDCRRCVDRFAPLDKLVALEAQHHADKWKRDHQDAQQRMADLERRLVKLFEPHAFEGEGYDCTLCKEGWCFYLHIRTDDDEEQLR